MTVNWIELESFRNYDRQRIEFDDGTNVIIGPNAQGKTNLLEAVEYMAAGRSFRTRFDRELISFGQERGRIRAGFFADGREQTAEIRFSSGRRKEIYKNGVRLKSLSELAGSFRAVLFCPEDLNIVKEGAAVRRRFMDMCLCQLRPGYAAALGGYNRAYESKTRILKDADRNMYPLLEEYDSHMAKTGARIVRYRAMFVQKLSEIARGIHSRFSGGKETLETQYVTMGDITDPTCDVEELTNLIESYIVRHRQAEMAAGMCLCGAHKDDIEIKINGKPARAFASQGQARTAALSMKLAEREIHFNALGEYPVLLLDDVLSELDETRQSFVLNRIGGGQTFITCCSDGGIAGRTGGRVINVNGGVIS